MGGRSLVVDDLDFFHYRGAVPKQVAMLYALVPVLEPAGLNTGADSEAG